MSRLCSWNIVLQSGQAQCLTIPHSKGVSATEHRDCPSQGPPSLIPARALLGSYILLVWCQVQTKRSPFLWQILNLPAFGGFIEAVRCPHLQSTCCPLRPATGLLSFNQIPISSQLTMDELKVKATFFTKEAVLTG